MFRTVETRLPTSGSHVSGPDALRIDAFRRHSHFFFCGDASPGVLQLGVDEVKDLPETVGPSELVAWRVGISRLGRPRLAGKPGILKGQVLRNVDKTPGARLSA